MAAIREILEELDDYGFSHLSEKRKLSLLNHAYRRINKIEAWPYLQNTEVTVPYTGRVVTTPSDFLRPISLFIDDSGSRRQLRYATVDYFEREINVGPDVYDDVPRWFIFGGGDPELDNNTLNVYPGLPPGQTRNLLLRYIKVAPALDIRLNNLGFEEETELLLPPRHRETLCLLALSNLFALERDAGMSAYFRDMYNEAFADMRRDLLEESYDQEYVEYNDFTESDQRFFV